VVTEHGMVLQTDNVSGDPTPTRLAVLGPGGTADLDPTLRASAGRQHIPVDAVHGPEASSGFDGALENLAMSDYPPERPAETGRHRRRGVRIPPMLAPGLVLVAVATSQPACLPRSGGDRSGRGSCP